MSRIAGPGGGHRGVIRVQVGIHSRLRWDWEPGEATAELGKGRVITDGQDGPFCTDHLVRIVVKPNTQALLVRNPIEVVGFHSQMNPTNLDF